MGGVAEGHSWNRGGVWECPFRPSSDKLSMSHLVRRHRCEAHSQNHCRPNGARTDQRELINKYCSLSLTICRTEILGNSHMAHVGCYQVTQVCSSSIWELGRCQCAPIEMPRKVPRDDQGRLHKPGQSGQLTTATLGVSRVMSRHFVGWFGGCSPKRPKRPRPRAAVADRQRVTVRACVGIVARYSETTLQQLPESSASQDCPHDDAKRSSSALPTSICTARESKRGKVKTHPKRNENEGK